MEVDIRICSHEKSDGWLSSGTKLENFKCVEFQKDLSPLYFGLKVKDYVGERVSNPNSCASHLCTYHAILIPNLYLSASQTDERVIVQGTQLLVAVNLTVIFVLNFVLVAKFKGC